MLLTALSWCSVPEAFQELRFLPAWLELGCAARELRAPVLPFVCWAFGMDIWNLVALGAHSLGSAAGQEQPWLLTPLWVPELSAPA